MDGTLYLQLHKLSSIESEEALQQLLSVLWETRKTGLGDKSQLHSLLNLDSLSDLDPVLACLRSLIRKWVHQNLTPDGLLKLFPHDLPLHLQTLLVSSFEKLGSQWKDQEQARGSGVCLRGDRLTQPYDYTPTMFSTPNLGNRLVFKSMTWAMEKCNSGSAEKVAVISLKLQDQTKSSLNDIEVKFQLTKDTLEAMMRSLTYIREKLSTMVGTASGPSQKKQKQSAHVV